MVVQLDVVVLCLPAVDLSLDLVAIVVQDKEVRLDTTPQHGSDLLEGLRLVFRAQTSVGETHELKRTVPNEKSHSSLFTSLFAGKRGTETSTNGPPNGSPKDLGDIGRRRRQRNIDQAKGGRSRLSQDDVYGQVGFLNRTEGLPRSWNHSPIRGQNQACLI